MKLWQDYRAYSSRYGGVKGMLSPLFNPCFHCVCLYRLSSLLGRLHLFPIAKLIWYINRLLFHVDIDYRADLAGGFVLVHGLGVVIGSGVCSRGRLTVYQGVTLGGNQGKSRVDAEGKIWYQPVIEDRVKVYTNACVFGPVVISEGSVIKAGQIISKDL